MLLVDHFSNLAQAILTASEKASDLKKSLIALTTPVRHPGPITVSTDNAVGFQSLEKNKDSELSKLQITLLTADEFNKNFTAVIDKACQEIEAELRKIHPEGGKITDTDLAHAVLSMNLKLCRKEGVSAYEMHTAQKLESGRNLHLNDTKLRESQLSARRHCTSGPATHPSPKPGDTITNLSPQPKHTARDMYLVTASTPETVTAQKILHPLSDGITKIMSKQYTTHPKHVRILHSPPAVPLPQSQEPALPPRALPSTKHWSPIPQAFWDSDSEDEDYDH